METLFRNTLPPWAWGLALAVPVAILALYFLKLRRQPLEVPSTYLWRRTLEDLRVNSLWSRLRNNLLLWLQLLAVALALFALLRPGWKGTKLETQRLVILIDNSASMQTADAAENQARLDAAKRQAAALVDQMTSGMSAMVISFADQPRVEQEFTQNTRLLKERIAAITPTARATDIAGALELADSLANPAQVRLNEAGVDAPVTEPAPATLVIFSDGRFSDVKDFSLGTLEPIYAPLGQSKSANLAIVATSIRRGEVNPQEREAYVQVANLSSTPHDVVIEARVDGALVDAQRVTAPADGAASITFPLGDATGQRFEARIDAASLTTAGDRLAIDNVGYAPLADSAARRVLLVTAGNVALESALATEEARRRCELTIQSPSFLDENAYEQAAAAGDYDLVIFDGLAPKIAPRATTILIGTSPGFLGWKSPAEPRRISLPQIIDWERSHPLLANVDLGDVTLIDALALNPPAGAARVVEANDGPLVVLAPREGYQDLVIAFPLIVVEAGRRLRNTDWISRHSFPTFWINALDYLLGDASDAASHRPGDVVSITPRTSVAEAEVVCPDGRIVKVKRRGDEPLQFFDTLAQGVYDVREAGVVTQQFAVNLFDRAESDVRLRTQTGVDESAEKIAELAIGNIRVAAEEERSVARVEIWRPLLALMLAIVLVEWWVYLRRVSY